jgi:hypothetical protein
MKFGFYSKKDTTAELIDVREFNEIGQALTFFAARKGLPVDTFLELFTVVATKDTKNGKPGGN